MSPPNWAATSHEHWKLHIHWKPNGLFVLFFEVIPATFAVTDANATNASLRREAVPSTHHAQADVADAIKKVESAWGTVTSNATEIVQKQHRGSGFRTKLGELRQRFLRDFTFRMLAENRVNAQTTSIGEATKQIGLLLNPAIALRATKGHCGTQ